MTTLLNPYLNFRGSARSAMEFYQSVFGGELNLSTFAEGMGSEDPAEKDQIMHGQLTTASGFTLMGSDVPEHMDFATGTNTFAISLSGDDDAELQSYWTKLLDGGTATQPLEKAPWGDSFGMLVDRFGVPWMVNITGAAA